VSACPLRREGNPAQAKAPGGLTRLAQQVAGDDELPDLARAFLEAGEADVAVEALDGENGGRVNPTPKCRAAAVFPRS